MKHRKLIALDVGEKRIGVATAESSVKIAVPQQAITVDGHEVEAILRLVSIENATQVVVGFPRNQSGQPTAQTEYVQRFAARLQDKGLEIVFQDESLTSVAAEDFLRSSKKHYTRGDIDSHAAAVILTDYLESHHA